MPSPHPAIPRQSVDVEALTAWLETHAPAIAPPIRVQPISAGRSNLTYTLEAADGARFVLRRPPMSSEHSRSHNLSRECAIVSALGSTDLPVPAVVAHCDDAEVIGAPFFIMRFVAGQVVSTPEAARSLSDPVRARIGSALPATLAALHDLDVDAVGLGALRRDGGYVERQLRHWTRRLDDYAPSSEDLFRTVGAELQERAPIPQRSCLLHGDFKLENMLVSADGEISAVLDWELAAIGDPLADLGWLLAWWPQAGESARWISPPPSSAGGFCDRTELATAYAAESSLELSNLDYYVAFSYWRLSCINEATRARFLAGAMGEKRIDLQALEDQVASQLESASELLAGSR